MSHPKFEEHLNLFEGIPPLAAEARIDRIGPYLGYSEQLLRWKELIQEGARPLLIGESVLGNPIFGLEWGPEDATRTSIALGGIHAMEWIGTEVLYKVMQGIRHEALPDRRIIIVPIVNVDGFLKVERDLRARKPRFRRANARGVDLNRNWPSHFRSFNLIPALLPFLGRSGPAPMSEPEVAAVMQLIESSAATTHLDHVLSMHSFGKMILLPYGGRWSRPEGFDDMLECAEKVQESFHEKYTIRQCARWFPGFFARGMELDSIADHTQAKAILIECSSGGLSLFDPRSWFSPFRWFNPKNPEATIEGLAPTLNRLLENDL